MSVPAGQLVYTVERTPCSGVGVEWSSSDMDAAMEHRVPSVLFDWSGDSEIMTLLTDVAESEFGEDSLQRLLDQQDSVEDWRVGEAVAEVYLSDHRQCFFPWPVSRDSRTRRFQSARR